MARQLHAHTEEISQPELSYIVGDIFIEHQISIRVRRLVISKALGCIRLSQVSVFCKNFKSLSRNVRFGRLSDHHGLWIHRSSPVVPFYPHQASRWHYASWPPPPHLSFRKEFRTLVCRARPRKAAADQYRHSCLVGSSRRTCSRRRRGKHLYRRRSR